MNQKKGSLLTIGVGTVTFGLGVLVARFLFPPKRETKRIKLSGSAFDFYSSVGLTNLDPNNIVTKLFGELSRIVNSGGELNSEHIRKIRTNFDPNVFSNWWFREIGVPVQVALMGVFSDFKRNEEWELFMRSILEYNTTPFKRMYSGADESLANLFNKLIFFIPWFVYCKRYGLTYDETLEREIIDYLNEPIKREEWNRTTLRDGFYDDGSFIYHNSTAASTSYLIPLVEAVYFLKKFGYPRKNLEETIFERFKYVTYDGWVQMKGGGRGIVRVRHIHNIASAFQMFQLIDPEKFSIGKHYTALVQNAPFLAPLGMNLNYDILEYDSSLGKDILDGLVSHIAAFDIEGMIKIFSRRTVWEFTFQGITSATFELKEEEGMLPGTTEAVEQYANCGSVLFPYVRAINGTPAILGGQTFIEDVFEPIRFGAYFRHAEHLYNVFQIGTSFSVVHEVNCELNYKWSEVYAVDPEKTNRFYVLTWCQHDPMTVVRESEKQLTLETIKGTIIIEADKALEYSHVMLHNYYHYFSAWCSFTDKMKAFISFDEARSKQFLTNVSFIDETVSFTPANANRQFIFSLESAFLGQREYIYASNGNWTNHLKTVDGRTIINNPCHRATKDPWTPGTTVVFLKR